MRLAAIICVALMLALPARADVLRAAVAANFLTTATALADAYKAETGQTVDIASGATGALYTQIMRGAPFDLFLAADAERPAALLAEGRALAVKTFALGRLVLVADADVLVPGADVAMLLHGKKVAVADPALAPYGAAALRALVALGVDPVRDVQLIKGANVGQTASHFALGTTPFAFVAAAQLPALEAERTLSALPIRARFHAPIRQDVALLSGDADARAFYDWLSGPSARALIGPAGYGLPE